MALCAASYSTGEEGVYAHCTNPATHRRVSRVEDGWVVTVDLCTPHAELWDEARVGDAVTEASRGRE